MEDTVFALSTPLGGAMAVIRVSGPSSLAIGEAVFTGSLSPRYAAFGRIVERGTGTIADEAVAVYFQAPSSYTGEDMLEFYVHGGSAAVKRVMKLIAAAGCSPAGPGEFTKRAFLNGKMDLCRAEAVADIISAASSQAAKLAAEQLSGALSRKIEEIEANLVSLLSGVSAAIDYPEELEEDVFGALPAGLAAASGQLSGLIEGGASGRVLREGARVVIVGRPNAGKSSLMNAMLGIDRAIVSDISGTTRDIIEEQLDLCGVPVRLTDTAGLHESTDPVERMGMERARSAMESASLLLLAFDGSEPLSDADRRLLKETGSMPRVAVIGKGDLPLLPMAEALLGIPAYVVSAKTGEGIETLCRGIADMLAPEREAALVSNARHIEALRDARAAVESAGTAMDADCVATDLRDALTALARITGSEVDETVIDTIFSRFCVGK